MYECESEKELERICDQNLWSFFVCLRFFGLMLIPQLIGTLCNTQTDNLFPS